MTVPDVQPHTRLTPREREVLALVQRGLTNPAIAAELGITQNAVRYHLKELHSKLATAGDRTRLNRIGWLGSGTIFGWKVGGANIAAAGFIVAASATGFWAVRSAHESSAERQDATGTTTHCVALAVPTVIGAGAPDVPAQHCFDTPEEVAAFYESLR